MAYFGNTEIDCGMWESIHHVWLDCEILRELRGELRTKFGDAFNSMSTLLGGQGEDGRGKTDSASRTKAVEPVWTSLKSVTQDYLNAKEQSDKNGQFSFPVRRILQPGCGLHDVI
jgi:hypothetical protein